MDWTEQNVITMTGREELWGKVILEQSGDRWLGCVRDWQGNACADINEPVLGWAKKAANEALARLEVHWKAWQTKHGDQDFRPQARAELYAAFRALAEIEGWAWKLCPRPEDELGNDLLAALEPFGRE